VPLETEEKFCAGLMGLSLKNIKLRVYEGDKKIFEEMGEMLFTHFGISGPLALAASSHIRDEKNKNCRIVLDLKPALDGKQLDKRILSDFEKYKNKMFKNSLDDLLPKKLIPVFLEILEDFIAPDKKINEITKAERTKLVGLFKDFTMTFKAFRPIEEAIISCGGVKTDEIYSNKMESKLINGLYFAGEIIDVDAHTGGFNLQIAFSTGKLAGKNASL
jgi:predicted Rossmann fold flavoprotein